MSTKKFKVSIWFEAKDFVVNAASSSEAKKKVYAKLKLRKATSFIRKNQTEVIS